MSKRDPRNEQHRGGRRPNGRPSDRSAAREPKAEAKPLPPSTLPRWVVEALTRVTPKARLAPAMAELEAAADAFEEGRFEAAAGHASTAKDLSPRDPTIRELLGLCSYRTGDWETALRELRTYRRLAGEVTHLPVEMDCLRALGRGKDVDDVWARIRSLENEEVVRKEGAVVYASALLDEGRVGEARNALGRVRMSRDPSETDLRLWYVAARAAALGDDGDSAMKLRDAILAEDPGFPGIDELDKEIARAS